MSGTQQLVEALQFAQDYPNLHALIYSVSGYGKSTLAATFKKPLFVIAYDRWDNIKPYMRLGKEVYRADEYEGEIEARKATAAFYQKLHIPVTDVRDEAGKLLARIEHYYDDDPDRFTAYPRFVERMKLFNGNPKLWRQWGTAVLDSLTFFQAAAVGWERTVNNPGKQNRLNNFGEGRVHVEGLLYNRLGSADTNVLVLGHELQKELKSGTGGVIRGIAAMGELSTQIPAGFGEVWHLVTERDEHGELVRRLRTTTHEDDDGNRWFAKTQEGVPDGCAPTYEAIWARESA